MKYLCARGVLTSLIVLSILVGVSPRGHDAGAAAITSNNVAYIFDDLLFPARGSGSGVNDLGGPGSGGSIFVNALTGVAPGSGDTGTYTTAAGGLTVNLTNVPISTLDSSPSALTGFDTAILYQTCRIGDPSNSLALSRINSFLQAGKKVMIFDADGCSSIAKGVADWSGFRFPFATNSPGPLGASGSYVRVESSPLTSGLAIGPQPGDAVGDANIFTTFNGAWFESIAATNINGATGVVEAYARTGVSAGGLAIYEGEDFWFTFGPSAHLRLVFDDMLRQTWDPDLLPGTTPIAGKHKYVIFMEGIATHLDSSTIEALKGPCSNPADDPTGFGAIKRQLLDKGFVCSDFLQYSYAGGNVEGNGVWVPKPYTCGQSRQAIRTSVNQLVGMMNDFAGQYSDSEFHIVAHSLGGVVATGLYDRIINGTIPAGRVRSITTLDSPLNHVTKANFQHLQSRLGVLGQIAKFIPIGGVSCFARSFLSSEAAISLADVTDRNRASIRAALEAKTTQALSKGVRVSTLGNSTDCLWFLTDCNYFPGEWIDDTQSQVITTASDHRLFDLGTNGCNHRIFCIGDSHVLILTDNTTVGVVASEIGSQKP